MAHQEICLINNGHDADLLSRGIALACSGHKHIDRLKAQLMASGTEVRPQLDPDYDPRKRADQPVSEPFRPTARWARVPHTACAGDGCRDCSDTGMMISTKQLIVITARDWQVIQGGMQYAPIASTRQPRKRSRTHLPTPRRTPKSATAYIRRIRWPYLLSRDSAPAV